MSTKKVYTVSQFSEITGLSVRTLRYYDEQGLLKSQRDPDNGYRTYTSGHLALLQPILLYRELDFSLDSIKQIVYAKDFNLTDALIEQKELLLKRHEKTESMLDAIDVALNQIDDGRRNMDIFFEDFPKEKAERWSKLIDEQDIEFNKELQLQSIGKMSEECAREMQEQSDALHKHYAKLISLPIDSDTVQVEVRKHYLFLNHFMYLTHDKFDGISSKGYKIIAEQTLSNTASSEMIEHYAPGMAQHLTEAILYFADNELKKNAEELRAMGKDFNPLK